MTSRASQLLLVFVKEPIPGQVKTRLAESTNDDTANLYYQAMVQVLLEQLEGLQNTDVRFCFTPDDAEEAVPFWILPQLRGSVAKSDDSYSFTPAKAAPTLQIDFVPQGTGNLGIRLDRAFLKGFQDGYKKVAVIGSDCPDCGSRWIQAALTMLKNDDQCVIGPSRDGGYYLLALTTHHPLLFQNIYWSSEEVLEQTIQAAQNTGVTVSQLPILQDIDNKQDWDDAIKSPIGGKLKAALKRIQQNASSIE